MKCKDCKWWRFYQDTYGWCKRHSPLRIQEREYGCYPQTAEDDGCGDFKVSQDWLIKRQKEIRKEIEENAGSE